MAPIRNTPEGAVFLDRNSPNYVGGILEMANARLYGFWSDLTEALRTGAPQNETKGSGAPMFAKLYEEPERLEQFMNAMSGVSAGNFRAFAQKFDFTQVQDALRCRRSNRTTVLHGRGGKSSYAMYELRPAQGRAHCEAKNRNGGAERPRRSGRVVTSSSTCFPRPMSSRWA